MPIFGSHVSAEKAARARELRGEMTAAETVLWARLRRNQLEGLHFRRQQVLHGFIVDFYCHEKRLIVEVDGPVHAQRSEIDTERDTILRGHEFQILRLTNDSVLDDIETVLREIASAVMAVPPLRPVKDDR